MIGVEGQYLFEFSIGDRKDFIESEDLIDFTLVEEAGNIIPKWNIQFKTKEPDLFEVFHEGNDLEVSFGVTKEELIDIRLLITKAKSASSGSDERMYIASGVLSVLPYITNAKVQITDELSAIEVSIETAKKHLTVNTNIKKSEDKQNWVQYNITDKRFIDDVLDHAYVEDSIILKGITSYSELVIRNLKTWGFNPFNFTLISKTKETEITNFRKGVYITFTPIQNFYEDLAYTGGFEITSQPGFINSWLGYDRCKPIYKIKNDTTEIVNEKFEPFLAMSDKLQRRKDIIRSLPFGVLTDNVYEKYYEAYQRNIRGAGIYSSVKIEVDFVNRFVDIKILDLVFFLQKSMIGNNDTFSFESDSGLYLIGKITRTVREQSFTTNVELFCESMNSTVGDLG